MGKIGRNDPCPCGSGKKYKKCCLNRDIIPLKELYLLRIDRKRGIERIEKATDIKKQQLLCNNYEEYKNIEIPHIFPFNYKGNHAEHFIDDFLMDAYVKGNQLVYPNGAVSQYGNLGAVAVSDMYRGEVKDYAPTCKSSLGRKLSGLPPKEAEIYYFIAQLRIFAFIRFLSKFIQYTEWPFGTAMGYIIAQHYGLPTQYIDLTDDIEVALFFACCKHIGNNKYKPIDQVDLATFGKFAVLYHDYSGTEILPIGYQPFTRCYRQRGYFIDTSYENKKCWEYDLIKDGGFRKTYFYRTPELCKEVYDKFEGGEKLFPYDALSSFEKVIQDIKLSCSFTKDDFENAYNSLGEYLNGFYEKDNFNYENKADLKRSKDWWINELYSAGIDLQGKTFYINKKSIQNINDDWNPQIFMDKENIVDWGRRVLY